MLLFDALLGGLVLGGLYALIATGLNLQYGVARIMNLSYGEFVILGSFVAYGFSAQLEMSPLWSFLVIVPIGFAVSWLIYRVLMQPLVRRAPNLDALEADSILATFGLLFVMQGTFFAVMGGNIFGYSYLAFPIEIFGSKIAANRSLAFVVATVMALVLWALLRYTRTGTAIRALAVDPVSAGLVAINVPSYAALAFATGGALVAAAGVLVSMFLSFTAAGGVIFTMKALIVVIMGGVGNVMGGFVAAILLGLAESLGGFLIDPGLTLAINFLIFIIVLLWRPKGLFGAR